MYRVSLAVIYIVTGRMRGGLYWPKADFKQSLIEIEREPRPKERQTEKKSIVQNERADNLTTDVGTFPWQHNVHSHYFSKAITLYNFYYVRKIKPQSTRACVWILS